MLSAPTGGKKWGLQEVVKLLESEYVGTNGCT